MLDGLDHVVIAVRDLAQARERYAELLGRQPWWSGRHPGFGTANALFDLGGVGLELLSPDGAGPGGQVVAGALASRGEGLVALAFSTPDAAACSAELRARGMQAGEPRPGRGDDPASGAERHWLTVDLPADATRGLFLFAIERLASAEGARSEPQASEVSEARTPPPGDRAPLRLPRKRRSGAEGARSEPQASEVSEARTPPPGDRAPLRLPRKRRSGAEGARSEPQASEVSEALVQKLDHVVITTTDLEAALALYGETLGLRLALDRRFEERGLRILFFRTGGVTVEVVGRLEPGEKDAPDRFGGLAYQVGDADAARARVAEAGFDVSSVRKGAKPGTRVCTVRDHTCGVPTLLLEPSA